MSEEEAMNGFVASPVFVSAHFSQLSTSCVPEHLWAALQQKLENSTFDCGDYFGLQRLEDDDGDLVKWQVVATKEGGISSKDHDAIFLVDHAWTFRPDSARRALESASGLLERMAALLDLDGDETDRQALLERVMSEKWRLANTYCLGNQELAVEQRMPLWYIMDEFGSRIQHSDDPNLRMVPFVSAFDGAAYSLLFPVRDISEGEEMTRDFLEGPEAQDALVRKAMKNIFQEEDVTDVDWHQIEPEPAFFATSRENESYPLPTFEAMALPSDRKIRVYAEYKFIRDNLKHERFELVENPDEADVLWLMNHYKQFWELSELRPGARVNQFPYEHILTIKDLLCVVCRRKAAAVLDRDDLATSPDWLPTTFNLKTELPQFVSYFQKREKAGLNNHWIVKPWNLARALDTQVTPDLHHILKLPFSGPKIAQKYIENPVLFLRPEVGRVKFDVRYIVLLRSTEPLRVFAYDRFWLRFANVPFDLNECDVYEKHFTVMNYTEGVQLKQMFCHDFIADFESQYPSVSWSSVEKRIFSMLKSMFEAAVSSAPPAGLARSPQSVAMYAVDLMLAWADDGSVQPKLLEVNCGPDCKRACDYYPEFFDNVFSTLFLDQIEGQNVTLL